MLSQSDRSPTSSTTTPLSATTHPDGTRSQLEQSCADKWLCRKGLEKEDYTHKRRSIRNADPVAERAVTDIPLARFELTRATPITDNLNPTREIGPRQSLFHASLPPEDLSYSLRNFVTVNPVDDPNVLFARVAVAEGRATPGYVPPLPPPKRITRNEQGGARRPRRPGCGASQGESDLLMVGM